MKLRMMLASMPLVALLSLPLPAQAADEGGDAATRQQLDKAREDLAAAAARVAELSRALGGEQVLEIRHLNHKRPMIGVVLGASRDNGVRVLAVTPDGPAALAGLRSGDVITGINGQALDAVQPEARVADAQRALAGLEAGQQVRLDYQRDGRSAQTTVTADQLAPSVAMGDLGGLARLRALERLGDVDASGGALIDLDIEQLRADSGEGMADVEKRIRVIGPVIAESVRFDAWRWQGLRLAPLDAELGRYFGSADGVLVLKADGEGLAGLQGGDVIEGIDGEAVRTPREAMGKLAHAEPGQQVVLSLLRQQRRSQLTLTAPAQPDVSRWLAPPAPPAPPAAPPRAPAPPAPPSGSALPTPPAAPPATAIPAAPAPPAPPPPLPRADGDWL